MKKLFSCLIMTLITAFVLTPIIAFTQDKPELGTSVLGMVDALRAGGIGAILIAFVRLLQTDLIEGLVGKLHKGLVPALVILLGLVAEVIAAKVSGAEGGWVKALIQGLSNGGAAMAMYDTVLKHFIKKEA